MLRILELKLYKHPILGEINIDFSEISEAKESTYTTVLIGPNGTGKSYILQAIINIFREGAHFIKEKKRSGVMMGSFYLKYKIDKYTVEIANISFVKGWLLTEPLTGVQDSMPVFYKVNGNASMDSKYLPHKILASSMTFTDKFPAVRDKFLTQYHYLGIRNINSPSSAGTKSVYTTIVNSLTTSLSKAGFINSLKKILADLNYSPSIKVSYVPKYRTIFYHNDISPDDFTKMFHNWETTFKSRKNEPWGFWYFKSIEKDKNLLKKIVHFLNTKKMLSYGQGGRYFEYDLLKDTSDLEEFEVLFHLHKLDLVSYPHIELAKEETTTLKKEKEVEIRNERKAFGFSDSSSGEQNILFSLLTLLSNVEDKSIIIIDEPELSLHPNWQLKYFSIVKDVFKKYKDVHFLVATHSHFLISDLEGDNSSLVSLSRDLETNKIAATLLKGADTFGWAAEEVLLKVFKVATSRNYYVAEKLGLMLDFIASENSTKQSIREKFTELELDKISGLTNEDPLKTVYDTIVKEYVS